MEREGKEKGRCSTTDGRCIIKLTEASDLYLRMPPAILNNDLARGIRDDGLSCSSGCRNHLIILIGAFIRLLPLIFICPLDVGLARGRDILSFEFACSASASFCIGFRLPGRSWNSVEFETQCTLITRETFHRQSIEIARKLILDEKEREEEKGEEEEDLLPSLRRNEDECSDGVPANSCPCI